MTKLNRNPDSNQNQFHLFLVRGRNHDQVPIKAIEITITSILARELQTDGWIFDWSLTCNTTVFALTDKLSKIQGLLSFHNSPGFTTMDSIESAPYNRGVNRHYYGVGKALFALTAQISIISGNDGFVLLTPKTSLRNYYSNTMGTKEIGNGDQYLDTEAAHRLVDVYTTGGKTNE